MKRLFENCHYTLFVIFFNAIQCWVLASCWNWHYAGPFTFLEGEIKKVASQGGVNTWLTWVSYQRGINPHCGINREVITKIVISHSLKNRANKWTQRETLLFFSLSSLRGSLTGWRYRLLVENGGKSGNIGPKKHQHTMATTIPESSEQETGEAAFLWLRLKKKSHH